MCEKINLENGGAAHLLAGDAYYLAQALQISALSRCKIRKVGAVLVAENSQILAMGYNKLCYGDTPCWCEHSKEIDYNNRPNCPCLHAEQNALLDALNKGQSLFNAILYTTTAPCIICARLFVSAGIKSVMYIEEYRDESGLKLLGNAGIIVKKLLKAEGVGFKPEKMVNHATKLN